mmetsp:Transcript_18052/g.48517  ORF Transcript_18052/g.48517 Transcript_18052/m.48517 type:complete len:166 (+) Transcript_18052:166-663(+)
MWTCKARRSRVFFRQSLSWTLAPSVQLRRLRSGGTQAQSWVSRVTTCDRVLRMPSFRRRDAARGVFSGMLHVRTTAAGITVTPEEGTPEEGTPGEGTTAVGPQAMGTRGVGRTAVGIITTSTTHMKRVIIMAGTTRTAAKERAHTAAKERARIEANIGSKWRQRR